MIIPKPEIGALLLRKTISVPAMFSEGTEVANFEHPIQVYVVCEVGMKKRGKNKGIVDEASLEKVISLRDGIITHEETNYPLILSLTNRGTWWNKSLTKFYHFEWDPPITQYPSSSPNVVSSSISIPRVSPPLSIPMLPETPRRSTPPRDIFSYPSQGEISRSEALGDGVISKSWEETPSIPLTPTRSNRRWSIQSPIEKDSSSSSKGDSIS